MNQLAYRPGADIAQFEMIAEFTRGDGSRGAFRPTSCAPDLRLTATSAELRRQLARTGTRP